MKHHQYSMRSVGLALSRKAPSPPAAAVSESSAAGGRGGLSVKREPVMVVTAIGEKLQSLGKRSNGEMRENLKQGKKFTR